ncbi:hypothetical protein OIU85_013971 [Salix viminalis]|uniref:Uncharacterized protein n=1 Tax=Salix viminalis TaxID=40686 RepID=A0A9Q0NN28_SALVM|nr:hypothetical protein OIU85_013971 [Salix viminalis]
MGSGLNPSVFEEDQSKTLEDLDNRKNFAKRSKTPPLDEDLSFLEEETDVVPHDHGNGHNHYTDPDQFDEELDNDDDIENYKELEREREKEKSLRKSWRCWLQRSRDGRLQTRG